MDADFFPVQERLIKDAKSEEDAVFVVDVGGSIGHDLAEFAKKHSNAPGRLVLQDLPAVLGQIDSLDERIERMAYDFYTEQPLKGMVPPAVVRQSPHTDLITRCSRILHALGAPRLAG
jgi:hypothetical protein